jgi:hypothetical protein
MARVVRTTAKLQDEGTRRHDQRTGGEAERLQRHFGGVTRNGNLRGIHLDGASIRSHSIEGAADSAQVNEVSKHACNG